MLTGMVVVFCYGICVPGPVLGRIRTCLGHSLRPQPAHNPLGEVTLYTRGGSQASLKVHSRSSINVLVKISQVMLKQQIPRTFQWLKNLRDFFLVLATHPQWSASRRCSLYYSYSVATMGECGNEIKLSLGSDTAHLHSQVTWPHQT